MQNIVLNTGMGCDQHDQTTGGGMSWERGENQFLILLLNYYWWVEGGENQFLNSRMRISLILVLRLVEINFDNCMTINLWKQVKCIDMNSKVFLTGSYDTTFKAKILWLLFISNCWNLSIPHSRQEDWWKYYDCCSLTIVEIYKISEYL